jgi:hypothetical protein
MPLFSALRAWGCGRIETLLNQNGVFIVSPGFVARLLLVVRTHDAPPRDLD